MCGRLRRGSVGGGATAVVAQAGTLGDRTGYEELTSFAQAATNVRARRCIYFLIISVSLRRAARARDDALIIPDFSKEHEVHAAARRVLPVGDGDFKALVVYTLRRGASTGRYRVPSGETNAPRTGV